MARPNINKQPSPNSPAAPSTSSIHPRAGGAKQTGLRSPAQRHIVRSHGSYLGLRARPRGRAVWRGGRAERGAEGSGHPGRRGSRPAASGSPAAESEREAAPWLSASSCLAAAAAAASSSSQAASAGRLLRLGQHFPAVSHTPLREKSLLHTRTRPQTARSLEKIRNSGSRAKGVAEAKSSTEVRRLGSPLRAADAGGAGRRWRREANSVRQAKPLSPPFAPAGWHPSSRPCGLGRETAAAPPHVSGLRAEAERWPLPQDWLKARTGVRGSGEV